MISIQETREILGPLVAGKTDEEVDRIRQDTYRRVDRLFEAFKARRATAPNEKGQLRKQLAR